MSSCSLVGVPLPTPATTWLVEEYGIRDDSEFAKYDHRTPLKKSFHYRETLEHGANYTMQAGYKRLKSLGEQQIFSSFDDLSTIGKTGSLALVILFHGLNGQPSLWEGHLAILERYATVDSIALATPEADNCSLEDSSFDTLLGRIVDWTKRNPLKPICLFGQSNGSRIAILFETLLREKAPQTPVYVSLTGAVLFGSKAVQTLAVDRQHSCFARYNIYEDLSFGSECSKKLLKAVRKPLENHVANRRYALYAPLHGHHVYSLGSALPVLNPDRQESKKEKHYLVFNFGHNAIPLGVCEKQIRQCMKWVDEINLANEEKVLI